MGGAAGRVWAAVSAAIEGRRLGCYWSTPVPAQPVLIRGTFLRAKQEATVAVDLLNWLTGQGIKLPELQQSQLDVWQAEAPATRRIAGRFLTWAMKTKVVPAGLAIVPHQRGTSPRLAKPGQEEALKRVLDADGLETRARAAAILILVLGQQGEKIARLTWNDVAITEELVTIQPGPPDRPAGSTGQSVAPTRRKPKA